MALLTTEEPYTFGYCGTKKDSGKTVKPNSVPY